MDGLSELRARIKEEAARMSESAIAETLAKSELSNDNISNAGSDVGNAGSNGPFSYNNGDSEKVPLEASYIGSNPTPEEIADLVDQYMEDNELYCKTFFPRTCRQPAAPFHKRIDEALWSRRRKVAIKVFRDGAKTARIRMFVSKRIAYGISRTILFISKSEDAAEANITWLKGLVETNTLWAQFWGIIKGGTWEKGQIELVNTVLNVKITVLAVGIHGQIRGLNFEDFRPDLILCDDIEDEKTVNTPEQILKHSNLLHGTVMQGLASPMDNPDAMIVIIQTPLDPNDAVETAFLNAGPNQWSDWLCIEASCFWYDDQGNPHSTWPEKFSTEFLVGEKQAYIKINKLSVWLREKEVTIVSAELSSFKDGWLQVHRALPSGPDFFWDDLVLWIDPASSASATADFQAVTLTGRTGPDAWLIAYNLSRGQDIEDSVDKFFETWDLMLKMAKGKSNLKFGVEIVAYQRQLARAIKKEMIKRQRFAYLEEVQDKREKEVVIVQAFTPVASNGKYHCLESHTQFITDFNKYPRVSKDDLIESAARGLDMLDLTGRAGSIATGGVERAMTPSVIIRSAHRMIQGRGTSLGRYLRH